PADSTEGGTLFWAPEPCEAVGNYPGGPSELPGPDVHGVVDGGAGVLGQHLLGRTTGELDPAHRLEFRAGVELPGREHRVPGPPARGPEPLDGIGVDVRVATAEPAPER